MPTETEHKFLVKPELLPPLRNGRKITQGYLSTQPTVRVRISTSKTRGKSAFLTIKGPGLRSRAEFEYPIPVEHAQALLKLCGSRVLSKTRFDFEGWEIDRFHGVFDGLWMAEYEFGPRKRRLPALPKWIRREVTADPRYSNAALAFAHGLPAE